MDLDPAVAAQVRAVVDSVVWVGELTGLRFVERTLVDRPSAGTLVAVGGCPDSALRLWVLVSTDEEDFAWSAGSAQAWSDPSVLAHFASDLESWVCETSFAWGQNRVATIPPA